MKKNLLLLSALFLSFTLPAQTDMTKTSGIGYSGKFMIASSATASQVPIGTAGASVTWDCSGLIQESGTPMVNIVISTPTGTTYANDYPKSNLHWTDPVLAAYVGNNYYSLTSDSLVFWGAHTAGKAYEIYDDPEMELQLPFVYNTTCNNTYSKTNYYANGSMSSYQTGTNTITYDGYGTLMLPGKTYTNVARIKNVRTNSLGPTTTAYYWYLISTGERLMLYETNGGIKVSYLSASNTTVDPIRQNATLSLYPNPFSTTAVLKIPSELYALNSTLKIYNPLGEEVKQVKVESNTFIIDREGLQSGIYFCSLINGEGILYSGKLVVE